MKRVAVRILPRNEVLDSQGRAVQRTLERHGKKVSDCRIGKYVELELAGSNEEVLAQAREITEFVLYNPLIETFEIELLGEV